MTKSRPFGNADRLSDGEADQLLDYLERTPEKDVRAALMMTPELAWSCVSGKDLPPEIIARVQQFLAAGKAG
jgi:hypothetical protein